MPFINNNICDSPPTATVNSRNNSPSWNSPQQWYPQSVVAAAMALLSFPSSPTLTLQGENDLCLFQIRSSPTGNNSVDRLIAILDAALEIVDVSDSISPDDESSIVENPSSSGILRNSGHSHPINGEGKERVKAMDGSEN
jgi:hypothetical protein